MTGRRSLVSLSGSLALHALVVMAALVLVARESLPGAVIVELGEVTQVADAASPPGPAGVKSPPARVVQRAPRRASQSASGSPAERVPEPEPVSQSEPSPAPPARERSQPGAPIEAEVTGPERTDGGSIRESVGGGIPRGGPLAMLTPSSGLAALGPGGGGEGRMPGEFGPYLARFRQRLQEALGYPPAARRRGLGGTVQLEVEILPTGKVASVVVLSSSSHPVLDEAALDAVRRLSPGPFPPGAPSRPLRVRLPVVFELK